jgi:tetratricopeptide (TPR) repeat protein
MGSHEDRALREQANALLRAGQIAQADLLLSEHAKARPNDHEALAIRAQIASMQRRLDDAESLLMRALRGDKRRADYHALLAEVLTTAGRHRAAISRYDTALKIQNNYDAAHAGKAETYLRMGKVDRAVASLEKAPDTPITAIPKLRALMRQHRYDDAISVARAHLPATQCTNDVQRGLWFGLGQASERAEQYKNAFEAFLKANALSMGGWTDEIDQQRNEVLMRAFSADSMPTLPRAECISDRPLFVVGLPRCGSTLVEQIIDAHPDATGVGEIETLAELVLGMSTTLDTKLPWPELLQEVNEQGLTSIAEAYLADLKSRAPVGCRVVDKQLGNFVHVGLIALLFPNARIIHCTRDPMDLGLSIWTQKLPPGTNSYASDLAAIGSTWRSAQDLMAHWEATLDYPILEVNYETLVGDLEGQTRRLLEFCDLPFDERCLRFWETGRTVLTLSSNQVRKPIYAPSVGRHAPWGSLLDPLRAAIKPQST